MGRVIADYIDVDCGKRFGPRMPVLISSMRKGVTEKKTKPKNDMVGKRLQGECWEGATKVSGLPPVNGHTGIFAYHCDDCMCSMGGWPCFRDGSIWSCCGSTDRDSKCTKTGKK